MTFHSEETAAYRYDKGVARHRKGVNRLSTSPQGVFGGHQCAHQTLRRAFLSNCVPALLTVLFQQCQDVEDKLGDFVPWLIKLNDSLTAASADDNHEEAKRREQLIRCAPHPHRFIDPN